MAEINFMANIQSDQLVKHFDLEVLRLTHLQKELADISSYKDKATFLEKYLQSHGFVDDSIEFAASDPKALYCYYLLFALNQPHIYQVHKDSQTLEFLKINLFALEDFYFDCSGLIEYQIQALKLLKGYQTRELPHDTDETFYPPKGIDLDEEKDKALALASKGLKHLDQLAEMYPVGGAADRLQLQDDKTHFDLPAAKLEFLGKTLLEGMIRDLQAREYLYYKVFGKEVTAPIALMTSEEKNNDQHIRQIFIDAKYFGRDPKSVRFFKQPLVPAFDASGVWYVDSSHKVLLKPGGHGVIWKLAKKQGVLQWLSQLGKEELILRQINNPMAGTDFGLLALSGLAETTGKCFGFASCERKLNTCEGINIVWEKQVGSKFRRALSNIEYCDFKKFNIFEEPKEKGSKYSVFPSNTNILFARLGSIEEAIVKCPFPGALVNFKEMKSAQDGGVQKKSLARVELLMQNIADGFSEEYDDSLGEDDQSSLRSFLMFNRRHKTISPTKKQFVKGDGLVETAVGCYYDYLKNIHELLTEMCHMEVPDLPNEEEFLLNPSFVASYHPALGPLYSVIAQKIQGGVLAKGSELHLEITELFLDNLCLQGSLLIEAENPLGHFDSNLLRYSDKVGKCVLKNVSVLNQGIDFTRENIFWKNKIHRKEALSITLKGNSFFYAENVVFKGSHSIVVPNNTFMRAYCENGEILFEQKPLDQDKLWDYSFSNQGIQLKKMR